MPNIKKAWQRVKSSVFKHPRRKFALPDDLPSIKDDIQHGTGNVINGHDYTDAGFTEIDLEYKDSILSSLPEIHGASLITLTVPRKGPGGKYRGIGWTDLFAQRTNWDKLIWPPMHMISEMAWQVPMNEDCMFRLWFCPPGLLHIEVDDDGAWSVQDIQSLPPWMLIG